MAGQKKYAAAEPLLLQGYQGLDVRQAQISPHQRIFLFEAAERLVQLYEATGKQDKAASWKKKLRQLQANQKHPIKP